MHFIIQSIECNNKKKIDSLSFLFFNTTTINDTIKFERRKIRRKIDHVS